MTTPRSSQDDAGLPGAVELVHVDVDEPGTVVGVEGSCFELTRGVTTTHS